MILKEFLKEYPRFSPLLTVPGVEELYEFIAQPSTIESMISASENRRPAIAAIAKIIESSFHDNKAGKDGMNFKKNLYLKIFIGNVISRLMQDNGYAKVRNKNLNPQESDYFSAGTLYVKDESDAELKEKAKKFWKNHKIGEKIITILENWRFTADIDNLPYAVKNSKSLKYAHDVNSRYSWIIEKHYDSRLWITSFQIAIELERRFPGIIALSELEAFEFGNYGYRKNYLFFTMIFDNLPEYAAQKNVSLETTRLLKYAKYNYEFGDDGYKIFGDKAFPLWRISKKDVFRAEEIKEAIENTCNEWNIDIFDALGLDEVARKVLNVNDRVAPSRQIDDFIDIFKLADDVSRHANLSNHISSALLFGELARRIWLEKMKGIQMDFLSGRYIALNGYSLTSKYIPIFRYTSK